MRELEFIPGWYPQLRHRRRMLMLQSWIALGTMLGLGIFLFCVVRSVHAKELVLNQRNDQVNQSNSELEKLTRLQALKKQMSEQARLLNRLGPSIPTGRLLDAIAEMMPKDMALLDLSLDVQLRQLPLSPLAPPGSDPEIDRQLNIQLHGVAPSDVEVGNFMIRLATIPHFTGSSNSTQDMHQSGRLMREFRISFAIDLNDADH